RARTSWGPQASIVTLSGLNVRHVWFASRSARTQQGDLLPNLARQSDGQRFDFTDRVEHNRVGRLLSAEGGGLGDEGRHLAAVVEVVLQLGRGHRERDRGIRAPKAFL